MTPAQVFYLRRVEVAARAPGIPLGTASDLLSMAALG